VTRSPALEAAHTYHDRGWALVPIRPWTKEPHTDVLRAVYGDASWGSLAQRRASVAEIEAWFAADPNAGIGVITGPVSDGLVVIDFDRRPSGLRLPETPLLWTPRSAGSRRGLHVYTHSSQAIPTKRYPWGEVRGFGGATYCVTAPSLHPRGVPYWWALPPEWASLADFRDVKLPGAEHDSAGEEPRYQENLGGISLLGPSLLGAEVSPDVDLTQFDADDLFVRAVAARLRIPNKKLGSSFCCLLPGHQERRPSANLWKDRRGLWVYRCHHGRDPRSSYALAEVFASIVGGRVITPNPPSLARWKVRLLWELGVIALDPVEAPPLPPSASRTARKLREGFGLLLMVTWWREPRGTPVTFTSSFTRDWVAIPESSATRAMGELLRYRVIRKVGETRCRGRATALYLPGDGMGAVSR
jgi:hypothetical protein